MHVNTRMLDAVEQQRGGCVSTRIIRVVVQQRAARAGVVAELARRQPLVDCLIRVLLAVGVLRQELFFLSYPIRVVRTARGIEATACSPSPLGNQTHE